MRVTTTTRTHTFGCALLLAIGAGCGSDQPPAGPETTTAETFTTSLSAAAVVGAAPASSGTGTATFRWDGTRLDYTLHVANMTQIIAAHIHGPATEQQNADIVVNLFIPATATGAVSGELASGAAVAGSHLLVGTTLNAVLTMLRENRAYVLVHTQTNPDGEIRGQVRRQ
jgi:hypothetical protein